MVMQIHKHNYVCECVGRGSRVGGGNVAFLICMCVLSLTKKT